MTFPDPEHSDSEQRYLNIGYSLKRRVLIVVHTERGTNIRIIVTAQAVPSAAVETAPTAAKSAFAD